MSDDNDNSLTKPKKDRSEAQKAAYLKMIAAREAKLAAKPVPPPKEVKMTPQEKKLRLQAIKEQLAGKKAEPVEEDESEEEVEEVIPPKKVKKEKQREKVDEPIMRLPKKQPKIIYQDTDSEDQSEEEVIVVKRRKKEKTKKPKKKTIIYEDSSSEEEEEPVKPVRKERETKTQQNAGSKFKVTPATAEKPKVVSPYYFAD
jgi:hypothetical protein